MIDDVVTRVVPAKFLAEGPKGAPNQEGMKWTGWANEIADRCDAAAGRYQLADRQLDNAKKLSVQTTLAPATQPSADPYEPAGMGELPVDKVGLRAFYTKVIAKLGLMARDIRGHIDKPPWVPIATDPIQDNFLVQVPIPQSALFIEARLALVIDRDGPGEDCFLKTTNAVPPSFVRQFPFKQKEPPVIKFADSTIQNLLPGYRAALGAPAEAGRPGESLWFVAESMLPNQAAPGDGKYPGYYALPPMRNAPASFAFQSKLVWPAGGTAYETRPAVNLLDVDADAYAKKALQMIEDLLDPRAIKTLMTTASGRAVLDQAVLAKESLARPLANMARRVLDDPSPSMAPPPLVASLADRFRRTLSAVYAVDTVLTYTASFHSGARATRRRVSRSMSAPSRSLAIPAAGSRRSTFCTTRPAATPSIKGASKIT